jgi:hypothetical protein
MAPTPTATCRTLAATAVPREIARALSSYYKIAPSASVAGCSLSLTRSSGFLPQGAANNPEEQELKWRNFLCSICRRLPVREHRGFLCRKNRLT